MRLYPAVSQAVTVYPTRLSQDRVWFLETLRKTCALLSQPGRFETTVSMEDEIGYSEEEEQVSLLPFLEEEEKEDKAGQFSSEEEHWEGRKFSDNSQKNSVNVSSSVLGGNRRVLCTKLLVSCLLEHELGEELAGGDKLSNKDTSEGDGDKPDPSM